MDHGNGPGKKLTQEEIDQAEGWRSSEYKQLYEFNKFCLEAVGWVRGASELSAVKWGGVTTSVKGWFTFGAKPVMSSAGYGKIIGWGEGQGANAVQKTIDLSRNLTTSQVRSWAQQGLSKKWVENQLTKYSNAIANGGAKLQNTQLIHRQELMQNILKKW
jgi:hypothetical protein